VKPALVVVAIAAGLLLLFGIGSALTGNGRPPSGGPTHVRGTALAAGPGTRALRPIEDPGTPPSDVLGTLVVPRRAKVVSATRWDGATQYSARMGFRLSASQAAVVSFYRRELHGRGWSILSVGAAQGQPRATEVLAQRASADGWYWEVGVVVSPTVFAGGSAKENTPFTLELFEVPDSQ